MKQLIKNLDLDLHLPKPPFWLVAVLVVGAVLPLLIGGVILQARVTQSSKPRIHLWQDMDLQPRYDAQQSLALYADGRAMRPRVRGTVARGQLRNDDHFYRGFYLNEDGSPVMQGQDDTATNKYYTGYPDRVTVDDAFVRRGRRVYNDYCFTCHGLAGRGDGPTHIAANNLVLSDATAARPEDASGTNWVAPTNITLPLYYEANYPNGHLYATITHGKGNMKGYGAQIEPRDRWALVAYVRALQLAQDADQTLQP